MNNNYKHTLFILDDSGSMTGLVDDAIGGFNQFLEEQKAYSEESGIKIVLDTILFGSPGSQRYIHRNMDVREIPKLTRHEYNAGSGATALLDAIGSGMMDLGNTLRKLGEDERPVEVNVQIFTDGMENASREFSHTKVTQMIEEQQSKYNWNIVFMASDLGATDMARRMHIKNIAHAEKSGYGMRSVFDSSSKYMMMKMEEKEKMAYEKLYNERLNYMKMKGGKDPSAGDSGADGSGKGSSGRDSAGKGSSGKGSSDASGTEGSQENSQS